MLDCVIENSIEYTWRWLLIQGQRAADGNTSATAMYDNGGFMHLLQNTSVSFVKYDNRTTSVFSRDAITK